MTTTTSQHTPGPWKVDDESAPSMAGVFVRVGGDPFNGNLGIPVSADSLTPYRRVGSFETEMRANARLIAAAPEMLEMLRQVNEDIGFLADANSPNTRIGKFVCIPIERVRALLAKIEGRS